MPSARFEFDRSTDPRRDPSVRYADEYRRPRLDGTNNPARSEAMSGEYWIVLLALVGFIFLWLFVLPRMGLG